MNEDIKKIRNHISEYFSDIKLDKIAHMYTVSGIPIVESVSGRLKQYYTPFNKNIAYNIAKKSGKPVEEIIKDWDNKAKESIIIGNRVHSFAEIYTFHKSIRPPCNYSVGVMKYIDSIPRHIVPVFVELEMYHKEHMYAGTLDNLYYNIDTGMFIIIDWKTNKDLHKNYKGKKLLGKFSDYLETPLNKYKIQQNYYKILIEQCGIKVSHMMIVHIKPDSTYEEYIVEDLIERLL